MGWAHIGLAVAGALALGACSLSLTPEPPVSLLTLTSTEAAPDGTSAQTSAEDGLPAIAVFTPETPAKLNVTRVPVSVSDTEIAYLQDAVWVEKPARLFRNLMGEALRAKGGNFVLDSDDTPAPPQMTLRGTLREFGYDAQTSSVVIRFDAVRTKGAEGPVDTKRFEARESGVLPETAAVGPALNRVANSVAQSVAGWVTNTDTDADDDDDKDGIEPSAPPIMDDKGEK